MRIGFPCEWKSILPSAWKVGVRWGFISDPHSCRLLKSIICVGVWGMWGLFQVHIVKKRNYKCVSGRATEKQPPHPHTPTPLFFPCDGITFCEGVVI